MNRKPCERHRIEQMRNRFRDCGILVNDAEPDEDDDLVILQAPDSLSGCRARVYCPGATRYSLQLTLISNDPARVITDFRVTSSWESEIRVLQPFETVPREYMDWEPCEQILNNRIGQAFGRKQYIEGLLLAEGVRTPRLQNGTQSSCVTVRLYDQFENAYSATVEVFVTGLDALAAALIKRRRVGKGAFEPDPDGEPREREWNENWLGSTLDRVKRTDG